jgi:hypothetical protein
MKWMNNLKIAVIENDITAIGKLIQNVPEINDLDQAKESLALIKEAILIVELEKEKTLKTMQKLKQTKAFLSS